MKRGQLSKIDTTESIEDSPEIARGLGSNPKINIKADYEAWRDRFSLSRLTLGLWLAFFTFLTFSILELINFTLNPKNFDSSLLLTQIIVQLFLLAGIASLRIPAVRRQPTLIFLWLSWSTTLLPQLRATLNSTAQPDIIAWSLMFFGQATLTPVRWPLHLTAQLGVLFYYFGVNAALNLQVKPQLMPVAPAMLYLYLFWACIVCNLSVYLYERLAKAEFKARRALEAERDRSERLLLNILPQPIAERLKKEPKTIADSFAEVSVLFADIVGFTELSARISPTELVRLLNEIFSMFDYLVERHSLEKIKTIGDAYMVVGGLPENQLDHAQAIAEMGLDMQQTLVEFNQKKGQNFQIRIGISTGLVVAGVIGWKKFAYDLWGDTVNTASRMESHGIPGAIQVSESTYQRLKDIYLFEERGEIEIKGKGKMKAYLLKSRVKDNEIIARD
ncbi:adenylate cyclase [Oscillatoriales cyanobacterium USR001]|nr:adenylate cyclase [Oscillatoriales cyanobacterium USR001]